MLSSQILSVKTHQIFLHQKQGRRLDGAGASLEQANRATRKEYGKSETRTNQDDRNSIETNRKADGQARNQWFF